MVMSTNTQQIRVTPRGTECHETRTPDHNPPHTAHARVDSHKMQQMPRGSECGQHCPPAHEGEQGQGSGEPLSG